MAVTIGPKELSGIEQERTCGFSGSTKKGQPYVVTGERERVFIVDGKVEQSTPVLPVTRTLDQIATQEVTLTNGKVISITDLTEALSAFFDRWAVEGPIMPSPPPPP